MILLLVHDTDVLVPCTLASPYTDKKPCISRFNSLRQRKLGWQMKQDMRVVLSSANGQNAHVMVLANSREVSPEARLQFLGDRFAAGLGAKDHVDAIFGERVGQLSPLAPGNPADRLKN